LLINETQLSNHGPENVVKTKIVMSFVGTSKQVSAEYFQLGHSPFLTHAFQ